MFPLDRMLRPFVKHGTLTIIDAKGARHVYSGDNGPAVVVRLRDATLYRRLFFNPSVVFGEAFMDGKVTVEEGELYDFLDLVFRNMGWGGIHWASDFVNRLARPFGRVAQHNSIRKAQRNAARHYNLNGELYDLFLDSDRQYSCAYFISPEDTLEQAQLQKKLHLTAKIQPQPQHRVLDIGCGWGGLALHIAKTTGAHVTGITLSEEQFKVARRRADEAGLSEQVEFLLRDYRKVEGKFDRIVSVGMFEHVGVGYYPEFFAKVSDLLDADGIALLHSIGRADGPGYTNHWISKHIFPGGYSPALSEVVPVVEKTGLFVTDIEILRLHYAKTLRHWRQRFLANRDRAAAIFDERFCRMWEFYLAASEAVFRYGGHMVFQVQMAKNQEAVPLTRDYITDWERQHRTQKLYAARAAE